MLVHFGNPMMKFTTTIVSLCILVSWPALSQDRAITLVTDTGGPSLIFTNEATIGSFETAKLVSYPYASRCVSRLQVIKDGRVLEPLYNPCDISRDENIVIAGPAVLRLYHFGQNSAKAFCTFEVRPVSFPPDRTLLVPPGTNRVAVSLESSTNLLQWIPATNGIYGSPTDAMFFRIRAQAQ
jgi:hypothetical protein